MCCDMKWKGVCRRRFVLPDAEVLNRISVREHCVSTYRFYLESHIRLCWAVSCCWALLTPFLKAPVTQIVLNIASLLHLQCISKTPQHIYAY